MGPRTPDAPPGQSWASLPPSEESQRLAPGKGGLQGVGPARAVGAIPLETKSCISGDPAEGRQLPRGPAGPEWETQRGPHPKIVAAARPGPSGNGPLGLKSYRLNLETALTECLLFRSTVLGHGGGEEWARVGGGGGKRGTESSGSHRKLGRVPGPPWQGTPFSGASVSKSGTPPASWSLSNINKILT